MPNSNTNRGSVRNNTNQNRNNNPRSSSGNNNYRTVAPPKGNNIKNPFFAYGIFKPGQLAYSRIKECVKNKYPNTIHYEMSYRDGVPLILPDEDKHFITHGYLIYFKDGFEKEAYDIISETEPVDLYKWKKIKVGINDANVLVGDNVNKGCSPQKEYMPNYEGRNDPFFKEAIRLIEKNLNKIKVKEKDKNYSLNVNDFFTLEMNYMLLWSAIERYSSLKYKFQGKGDNNRDFVNEDSFQKAFKKYVHRTDTVYNAEQLYPKTLNHPNPRNPIEGYIMSIQYYYTVRSNVVHRGKMINMDDYNRLRLSLEELLLIFKDVLKDTFKE